MQPGRILLAAHPLRLPEGIQVQLCTRSVETAKVARAVLVLLLCAHKNIPAGNLTVDEALGMARNSFLYEIV